MPLIEQVDKPCATRTLERCQVSTIPRYNNTQYRLLGQNIRVLGRYTTVIQQPGYTRSLLCTHVIIPQFRARKMFLL